MKSKVKLSRVLSAGIAAVMLGYGTVAFVSAQSNNTEDDTSSSDSTNVVATAENESVSKDETVYVIANADGSVKKIIVSDWLANTIGNDVISDFTELNNVENTKGDESFTINSDNINEWDAQGNDIYYKGTIEKELPVEMSVEYKLDDEVISPDELAGKSGKVTVRFNYKNNQKQTVNIDGVDKEIYVPFVMVTGTILDNENFTNVEVSNGKIVNDGTRTIVMGFAMPGMQESLDISKDYIEIPDYVEITADVTDFKLETTMTFATNEVFNNIKLDNSTTLDELDASLKELSDASEKLMNGSSALYDGLSELLTKSNEMVAGINKLYAGSKDLSDGADQLYAGTAGLTDGINQLNSGLNQLVGNNEKLVSGAKLTYNSLLAAADSQLAAAGLSLPNLTTENYETVLTGVLASIPAGPSHDSVYALYVQIKSYDEFYKGIIDYTAGVSAAYSGSVELKAGSAKAKGGAQQVSDGAKKLYVGLNELKTGGSALIEGVTQLKDGAIQLSDGMKEFNDTGIEKLVNAFDGDIKALTNRIKAVADVSKNYKSFAGIADDMQGSVKFIYKTDAIGE